MPAWGRLESRGSLARSTRTAPRRSVTEPLSTQSQVGYSHTPAAVRCHRRSLVDETETPNKRSANTQRRKSPRRSPAPRETHGELIPPAWIQEQRCSGQVRSQPQTPHEARNGREEKLRSSLERSCSAPL